MSAGGSAQSGLKSLLIVRLGAMGDVIHTLPAAATLRCAFPDAQIGWIIEERWAELLCGKNSPRSGPRSPSRPLVDSVHVVNTKSWRKSPFSANTREELFGALKEIRNQKYEIAIDFQGAIKSALLARLSGAGTVFGMQRPRESPARFFYTQRVRTSGAHVIDQYQFLANTVTNDFGARSGEAGDERSFLIEFPSDVAAEASITEKLRDISSNIAMINPGAGWAAKEWPPERYGKVAEGLARQGLATVVNYGPGEEELARAVESGSNGTARTISCSVGELIALTRRARLFIGGDTGPLHLAAALGVPVVAIFGPTDPARNGPFTSKSVVLRNPLSRTSLSHTSTPDPGLLQITPEEVISAARRLLEDTNA